MLDNPTIDEVTEFFKMLPELRAMTNDSIGFYNDVSTFFNCYGYAAGSLGSSFVQNFDGKLVSTMAVPGALANETMQMVTVDELHKAVIADGFEHVNPKEYTGAYQPLEKHGHTLVAALIDQDNQEDFMGVNFHFAVRGEDGEWTHKNGTSQVYTARIGSDHDGLREPHIHPEDYLGERYDFVGYYWRPDEGIHVIGGDTPVMAFTNDGKIVETGLYDPTTMRDDVWIGTRGDYVATSFEVKNVSIKPLADGDYSLVLTDDFNGRVQLTMPEALIFDELDRNSIDGRLTETGIKIIEIDDPSGADMTVLLRPDQSVEVLEEQPAFENRGLGSPFTR